MSHGAKPALLNAAIRCRSSRLNRRYDDDDDDSESARAKEGITPPDLENRRCPVGRDTPATPAASTTETPSRTCRQNTLCTASDTPGRPIAHLSSHQRCCANPLNLPPASTSTSAGNVGRARNRTAPGVSTG